MNKNSNIYTLIYASVLVLAVGIILSVVYQALRPAQLENIANDTKKQILAAALINVSDNESVAKVWDEHIVENYIVNSLGEKCDPSENAFDVNVATQSKIEDDKRKLPVFVCNTEQGLKYILPVYGAGLWGPIWGYVAFNADGTTIYGAYFAHQGETPGLGAEIEKDAFRDQFQNKSVFSKNGTFESVAVVKNGQEPAGREWVHAVSGGTITSQGVQKMLYNSLKPYSDFLHKLQNNYENK